MHRVLPLGLCLTGLIFLNCQEFAEIREGKTAIEQISSGHHYEKDGNTQKKCPINILSKRLPYVLRLPLGDRD